ncbi:MAG: hypothetical protein ACTH9T_05105 [Mycetocola reblochoni]|uniref:hypothetical protein n=1 Tax=Mycetocola reblochoni TaxID=331618 RepID=UPI001180B2C1|nr:hypothetical protein [Mycetocola reblochoni]
MRILKRTVVGLLSLALAASTAGPAVAVANSDSEPTIVTTLGYVPENAASAPIEEVLLAAESENTETSAAELSSLNRVEIDGSGDAMQRTVATASGVNPYSVKSQWRDNKHRYVVVRYGATSTFGWNHAKPHNVTMAMIKKTTQFPKTRVVSGKTTAYETPAIEWECWLASCHAKRTMTVRAVVATQVLRDNVQKGLITAYCKAAPSQKCPAWVVKVAG